MDIPPPLSPDLAGSDAAGALAVAESLGMERLLATAEAMTLAGHGALVTYSRKVFIPLTQLCRDVCHYCTFAHPPSRTQQAYLSREQVLAIARAGAAAGCREALFTLGDRPEARYRVAREELAALGHETTLSYLGEMARAVLDETGLIPHLNPGLMDIADYQALRPVSGSMGIMLESSADRLCAKGGPHHGSPDKQPAARLAAIEAAGMAGVPFTTGILIGIGETRAERIEALIAIRDSHARHGHIQEVIVQNFRAKPGTRMAGAPEPSTDEHLWSIAMARLILGPAMTVQAPPNLHEPETLGALLRAGVNDWGGVSPVTPDHVNPEAPWPHLDALEGATRDAGRTLRERLAIGPALARQPERWLDKGLATTVRRQVDGRGLPVVEDWRPGLSEDWPLRVTAGRGADDGRLAAILARGAEGARLDVPDIVRLFEAEGPEVAQVTATADWLRRETVGDTLTFVANRNINYTNMCLYRCSFCAFSKGTAKALRGPAYRLDLEEITRRTIEAAERGATEVCLQGGIHPDYDGHTYLSIVRAVKDAVPDMHVHAFSPLEISHGAETLGLPVEDYLRELKAAGLGTLPGTAAEVLDDRVRAEICPDKLDTAGWLGTIRAAHRVGLRTTATIMFGHVDRYDDWARHLLAIRDLQAETGGFTEFVPLPFVHLEAPMWRRGQARSGPSARESLLMHAIARIVLRGLIPNIQVSWVKMGDEGVLAALAAGANDMGGTLMDESITRAAGGGHGQQRDLAMMTALAARAGRPLRRRNTVYGEPAERLSTSDRIYA